MARKSRERGTVNVLADLGFEDAEELAAKATLALKVNQILTERGLTQVEAGELLGMPQSKVSQIKNYKLQNISLERLMQALVALDQRVEIVVKPVRRREQPVIAVTA
jgi:predicted XRE-type DNA-binding protein